MKPTHCRRVICFPASVDSDINLTQNHPHRHPEIMFDQISGQPVAQSSWQIKLTITGLNVEKERILSIKTLRRYAREVAFDPGKAWLSLRFPTLRSEQVQSQVGLSDCKTEEGPWGESLGGAQSTGIYKICTTWSFRSDHIQSRLLPSVSKLKLFMLSFCLTNKCCNTNHSFNPPNNYQLICEWFFKFVLAATSWEVPVWAMIDLVHACSVALLYPTLLWPHGL